MRRTSSSISSSDPNRTWRRFAAWLGATLGAGLAALYGFVVLVDPWDTLPLSPQASRVPISTNARFSFPALARSPRFDAVILGTSTARLLQPAQLDAPFQARFANLAMNSATAYEQSRLLEVFLRAHPRPRAVVIGLDASWCGPAPERYTPRPFPEWMYGPNRWAGYREMLTPYAVQEAANQFAVMAGWKRRRYGLDGYTSFVPDDAAYDRGRVAAAFERWPPVDQQLAGAAPPALPAMAMLAGLLRTLPPVTQAVLFFPPNHISQHGEPGSAAAAEWAACKAEAARIAVETGATVLDFMVASPITTDRDNYWDPLHYRTAVAGRVATALAGATSPDVVRLR